MKSIQNIYLEYLEIKESQSVHEEMKRNIKVDKIKFMFV